MEGVATPVAAAKTSSSSAPASTAVKYTPEDRMEKIMVCDSYFIKSVTLQVNHHINKTTTGTY